MRKVLGLVLVATAIATLSYFGFVHYRVEYWIKSPKEKFQTAWQDDMRLLSTSQKLPKEWPLIKEVSVKSDNSPAQEWIQSVKPPISTTPKGRYKLEVFFIHWIEGYRYGVVVQYNLVDLVSSNTIWEQGRTFKLGIVY